MALFSTRTGLWSGRFKALSPADSPYEKGSVGYTERHRVTETVLPDGLTRIDIGGAPATRPSRP